MAEYVEREAAKKEFCLYFGGVSHAAIAVRLLDETPAADVAPVVHGRWVYEPPYRSVGGDYLKAQECSVCRAFYVSDGNKPYSNHNYCPNCGARMDGE